MCTSAFGKHGAKQLQWGIQWSWEGCHTHPTPTAPHPDPATLISHPIWRRTSCGFRLPMGQLAFISVMISSSQRLRNNTVIEIFWPQIPATPYCPNLVCPGASLLESCRILCITPVAFCKYGNSQPCCGCSEA